MESLLNNPALTAALAPVLANPEVMKLLKPILENPKLLQQMQTILTEDPGQIALLLPSLQGDPTALMDSNNKLVQLLFPKGGNTKTFLEKIKGIAPNKPAVKAWLKFLFTHATTAKWPTPDQAVEVANALKDLAEPIPDMGNATLYFANTVDNNLENLQQAIDKGLATPSQQRSARQLLRVLYVQLNKQRLDVSCVASLYNKQASDACDYNSVKCTGQYPDLKTTEAESTLVNTLRQYYGPTKALIYTTLYLYKHYLQQDEYMASARKIDDHLCSEKPLQAATSSSDKGALCTIL